MFSFVHKIKNTSGSDIFIKQMLINHMRLGKGILNSIFPYQGTFFESSSNIDLWQGPNTAQKWSFSLTLIKIGERLKRGGGAPTIFSPVTSTNVGISPKNYLAFSFNPFATIVQNFKATPSASHKLLNLNQDHPQKKWFFWLNPYKLRSE